MVDAGGLEGRDGRLGQSVAHQPLRELPSGERTLPRLLERQAAHHRERPLFRTDTETLTYAQARDRAASVGEWLGSVGIRRSDVVAVMSENRVEMLELWLGCAWRGAIFAPLNTALRGPALEHALALVRPTVVVSEQPLRARLDGVAAANASARLTLPAAEGPFEGGTLPESGGISPPEHVQPGDAAVLLFTSGTTGPSKAVICPHGQWFWWGVVVSELLGLREDDVLYTNLPLFHTNAMSAFCQALVTGASIHVGPRFSGSRYWSRVREADATVGYLLGTMAHVLVTRAPERADRVHRLRVALAPGTRADVAIAFRDRFGVELVEAWGATEANAAIGAPAGTAPPGTMGRVLDGFEARVVDKEGNGVPDGVPGELVLRSALPFAFSSGYFGMPEATVEAWRDLWLHTGDRVVRRDGVYAFVDRLKDAIRRRGENISAWEVEQALLAHPSVGAAAVVGVPAELGEEEVLAFVVPRDGDAVDPEGLIRACEPLLPGFALPRYVEIVDELPLTPSGRVEKYRLRERGLTQSTWDRTATAR